MSFNAVRIVREDEIEVVNCPDCGADNVLTAPESCANCAQHRRWLNEYRESVGLPVLEHRPR